MKNSQRHLKIYLGSVFLIILIAAALRTVAILTELDFSTGYFEDKLLIGLANSFVVAMALLSLSYLFVASKAKLVASFDNVATFVPSGLVSVALIFIGVHLFATSEGNFFVLIVGILALVSILHFLYNSLVLKRENATRGWFALATVVFLAAYAAYLYFDVSLPLNSPNRITDIMAFLFAALFFLYEARISLGRAAWRAYIAFGLIASLLLAYSSIPSIITYFVRGAVISNSIAESALSFALFIFIVARMLIIAELKEDEKDEFTTLVSDMAEARREEIRENLASRARSEIMEENIEEPDENYTIDFSMQGADEETPIEYDITEEGDEA